MLQISETVKVDELINKTSETLVNNEVKIKLKKKLDIKLKRKKLSLKILKL